MRLSEKIHFTLNQNLKTPLHKCKSNNANMYVAYHKTPQIQMLGESPSLTQTDSNPGIYILNPINLHSLDWIFCTMFFSSLFYSQMIFSYKIKVLFKTFWLRNLIFYFIHFYSLFFSNIKNHFWFLCHSYHNFVKLTKHTLRIYTHNKTAKYLCPSYSLSRRTHVFKFIPRACVVICGAAHLVSWKHSRIMHVLTFYQRLQRGLPQSSSPLRPVVLFRSRRARTNISSIGPLLHAVLRFSLD